jgi:CRISPR system Cascade subunit CasE
MHLSQFMLSESLAADVYGVHRRLHEFFPQTPDEKRTCLYRVEPEKSMDSFPVLVVSDELPKRKADPHMFLVGTLNFDPKCFQEGEVLSFRCLANASITKKGKRHPVIGEDALMEWLTRKLEGAAVLKNAWISKTFVRKFLSRGNNSVIANEILFEGVLEVTNQEHFAGILKKGIGKTKGFGYGLLSVRRM